MTNLSEEIGVARTAGKLTFLLDLKLMTLVSRELFESKKEINVAAITFNNNLLGKSHYSRRSFSNCSP